MIRVFLKFLKRIKYCDNIDLFVMSDTDLFLRRRIDDIQSIFSFIDKIFKLSISKVLSDISRSLRSLVNILFDLSLKNIKDH